MKKKNVLTILTVILSNLFFVFSIIFYLINKDNDHNIYLLVSSSVLIIISEIIVITRLVKEINDPYKEWDRMLCPVCHKHSLIEWIDICHECGWQHNMVQYDDPDLDDGPNKLSLNDTREYYQLQKELDPNYTWKANATEIGNPSKDDLEKLREKVKTIKPN